MQFTLGMYGEGDFFMYEGCGRGVLRQEQACARKLSYDPKAGKPFLHPGRQANIIYDGEVMGYLG